MTRFGNTASKVLALLVAVILCASSWTVCLADAYSDYYSAYGRLTKNKRFDANIDVELNMEGETSYFSGSMKTDEKGRMYYELICPDETYTYFCDGKYLYLDRGGEKVKFIIDKDKKTGEKKDEEPVQPTESEGADEDTSELPEDDGEQPENVTGTTGADNGGDSDTPAFDIKEFLKDFSSMLDATQLKEMGLMSPIPKLMVTNTTKDGNVYTLKIADAMVDQFLKIINDFDDNDDDDETIQFTQLDEFIYKATVNKKKVVEKVGISGEFTVHVPAKYMTNRVAKDYTMYMDVQISFNNPGKEEAVILPSTDGYEEVTA